MGNFCIAASGKVTGDSDEDLHRQQSFKGGKTAKVITTRESDEGSLETCSVTRCVTYLGDAGGDPLTTFIMLPAQAGGRGAQKQNQKASKAKGNRETVNHSPDSSGQIKKSKTVQKPSLEKPSQTAGQLNPSRPKHGEARERTSDIKSPPEKAKLSGQDCQQSPTGISSAEDENSDVDLYRGAEEIEQERKEKHKLHAAPNFEDQISVAAPERMLSYSQREWKGNTSKSRLIKKGYEAIGRTFESLRRVRGDNYCALRATLFQILSESQVLPDWLQDPEIFQWPKQMQSVLDLVDQWRFPFDCKSGGRVVEQLECCLKHLKTRWQEAVQCASSEERELVCQKVFVGQREEYELLEALKFLMLKTAIKLHSDMEKGSQVPEFSWLLFARDTSKCPRSFLTNHLRHVGFSGGLEQVEMFLLGFSLQQTIKVYRLYKTDTEEFITYYPDSCDHNWPCLSLVTEDDRHYNVPVVQQAKQPSSKPIWNRPSGGQDHTKH
ncbi:hypothetical protein NFI96_028600 [Prochilodus magdalenae]|nr:hypothetical protein NFI96_028600 [Prochilodus magdalenae]